MVTGVSTLTVPPVTVPVLLTEAAAEFDVCAAHAKEVERVAAYLTDRAVSVRSLSTTALWEIWLADENPFLARHAAALQRRYTVAI